MMSKLIIVLKFWQECQLNREVSILLSSWVERVTGTASWRTFCHWINEKALKNYWCKWVYNWGREDINANWVWAGSWRKYWHWHEDCYALCTKKCPMKIWSSQSIKVTFGLVPNAKGSEFLEKNCKVPWNRLVNKYYLHIALFQLKLKNDFHNSKLDSVNGSQICMVEFRMKGNVTDEDVMIHVLNNCSRKIM